RSRQSPTKFVESTKFPRRAYRAAPAPIPRFPAIVLQRAKTRAPRTVRGPDRQPPSRVARPEEDSAASFQRVVQTQERKGRCWLGPRRSFGTHALELNRQSPISTH